MDHGNNQVMVAGTVAAQPRRDGSERANLTPLILFIMLSLAVPVWFHLMGGMAEAGQEILVIYPPGWSASDVLRQSASVGVPIISTGRVPFAMTLISEGPETIGRAYSSGAVLVLKSPLSAFCGS